MWSSREMHSCVGLGHVTSLPKKKYMMVRVKDSGR